MIGFFEGSDDVAFEFVEIVTKRMSMDQALFSPPPPFLVRVEVRGVGW